MSMPAVLLHIGCAAAFCGLCGNCKIQCQCPSGTALTREKAAMIWDGAKGDDPNIRCLEHMA